MMIQIIINFLLLSLVFSVASVFALLLRKRVFRSRENLMCILWIAILIFAVMPVSSKYMSVEMPKFMRFYLVSDVHTPDINNVANITDNTNNYTGDFNEIDLAYRLYSAEESISFGTSDNQAVNVKNISMFLAYTLITIWICGALILFIKPIKEYTRTKKILIINSVVYDQGRISYLFDECRNTLDIRYDINICIVNENYVCSPCVVGLLQPNIFISSECQNYSDSQLKFILMHELFHIKRHDLLFKMLTLIVTSLHWFNPLAHIVSRAINEDCELACDSAVLGRIGRLKCDSYIYTILDIADRLCRSREHAIVKQFGGSLFIGGSSEKSFLERRYINMKSYKNKRGTAAVAALFISIIFIINAVIISSCGAFALGVGAAAETGTETGIETATVTGTGNHLFDEALRGYYRLTSDDVITQEHIDGITTLEIRLSNINVFTKTSAYELPKYFENTDLFDGVYIDYIVNGEEVNAFPKIIDAIRFKEVYLRTVNDYYYGNETLTEDEIARLSSIENPYITTKAALLLNAFYTVKDPNDPTLDKQMVAELKLMYPFITDYAVAIFDPYCSTRELHLLVSYYQSAGLFEGYTILDGCFEASSLKVFKNLESVIYKGVKPLNENLPVGAISRYYDYKYDNISLN